MNKLATTFRPSITGLAFIQGSVQQITQNRNSNAVPVLGETLFLVLYFYWLPDNLCAIVHKERDTCII